MARKPFLLILTACVLSAFLGGLLASRSFISQVRLTEMQTPERALVRHDDPTDLTSTDPTCYVSEVGTYRPEGAVTLQLRLNFRNRRDKIILGAVGVDVVPNCKGDTIIRSYTRTNLPTPGTAGRLVRVTDETRGIWMDQGSRWFPTNGGMVNTEEFGGVDLGQRFNAAITALPPEGGTIVIPPGEYETETELIIPWGPPFNKVIAVFAYGAVIKTKGHISGIKISGGTATGLRSIYGLTIDHQNNRDALYGFNIEQGWNVRLYDPTVVANDVSPTYGAIRVGNADPANPTTGSFWTKIINPWVRKRSSTHPGDISFGIILEGAANATVSFATPEPDDR